MGNLVKCLLLSLILGALSFTANASVTDFDQETVEVIEFLEKRSLEKKESIEFKGSYGIRYRYQNNEEDENTHNRFQHQLKLKMLVPLTQKARLVFEGQTGGDRFGNGWNNSIAFNEDDSSGEFDFRVRRAYVDYANAEYGIYAQVGAIPVYAASSLRSALQIDRDGWIDGLRVGFSSLFDETTRIQITYGNLSREEKGNFFQRDVFGFGDYDYVQIEVQGSISDNVAYQVQWEDVNGAKYIDSIVEANLSQIKNAAIDSIYFEALYSLDQSEISGYGFGVTKKDGKKKYKLGFLDNDLQDERGDYIDGFLSPRGKHLYFSFENQLFDTDLKWSTRIRKCIDSDQCIDAYRFETAIKGKF